MFESLKVKHCLKVSPFTELLKILWKIIPYLFIAANTEMFLDLASGTVTMADAPATDLPRLGRVDTENPASSIKIKLLSGKLSRND